MTRILSTLLAAIVLLQLAPSPAPAVPSAPANRYASIVVDFDTGEVLYERNADLVRYPASLTKMMTMYLVFEALRAKKVTLDSKLAVSAHAAAREPSKLGLVPGSTITLETALRGMSTKSANDAASVVAEALGSGSESKFAQAMTAKAESLGMSQTRFRNASGLPESGHVSSAHDLAVLSRAIIRDFPDYYTYFSTESFDFKGQHYPNQNRFLRTYFGADGIKTGYIHASGHNLAASALRRDRRLIAVVLGGDTAAWTREHAMRLMDVSYAKIDPTLVYVAAPTPSVVAASATVATLPATASTAPSVVPAAATTAAIDAPSATVTLLAAAAAVPAKTAPKPAAAKPVAAAPSNAAAASAPAATPSVAAAPAPAAKPGPTSQGAPSPAESKVGVPVAAKTLSAVSQPSREVVARAAAAPAATGARPASTNAAVAVAPATPPAVAPALGTPARRPGGQWSVQVGLFRDPSAAKKRGEEARSKMPLHLRNVDLVVASIGDGVHLASRFLRMSEQEAREACSQIQRGSLPCVVIPPGRPLVVATN